MSRNFDFSSDELYHVYNRGTEKRKIFLGKADYDRFLTLMYICNGTVTTHLQRQGRTLRDVATLDRGEPLVDIGAYVLMPNHFHLLLKERDGDGISRFMQKLTTGYTMYFNKRHQRSGALMQGKFKASHAGDDRYLKYLLAYIHLNPAKLKNSNWKKASSIERKNIQKYLESFPYSSYQEFVNVPRIEKILLDRGAVPLYFKNAEEFRSDIAEWLAIGDVKVGP